jgi:iron complex transport system permease protein
LNPASRDRLLNAGLGLAIAAALSLAVLIGETGLAPSQYAEAVMDLASGPAEVLWQVRAPRALCALMVGAALGLAGAVLQGLLRNPLADPGVLGVSATAALGAALAIVLGLAAFPGVVEIAALAGAALAGGLLVGASTRLRSPEALILFGVALSSFAGALTALIFNLSPSPIASAEVMSWLLGSVQNRSWFDVAWVTPPVLVAGLFAAVASPGLRMLALGEETAATSGLAMGRLKILALIAAAIAAGAAVAVAGVIGFVGLAAPHLVRRAVRGDPRRLLLPSALVGGLILVAADLLARITPTDQELKLGVFTALIGAPLFALIAWRAAREWRP